MGPLEKRFEKEKVSSKLSFTARDRERLGFFVGLNEVHSAMGFFWRMSMFSFFKMVFLKGGGNWYDTSQSLMTTGDAKKVEQRMELLS